jgi:hypothetical protein
LTGPRPAPILSARPARYTDGMAREDGVAAPVEAPGRPLEGRLAAVPARPGVYLLKDRQGRVIYVGKAANLRARVRSYVRGGD